MAISIPRVRVVAGEQNQMHVGWLDKNGPKDDFRNMLFGCRGAQSGGKESARLLLRRWPNQEVTSSHENFVKELIEFHPYFSADVTKKPNANVVHKLLQQLTNNDDPSPKISSTVQSSFKTNCKEGNNVIFWLDTGKKLDGTDATSLVKGQRGRRRRPNSPSTRPDGRSHKKKNRKKKKRATNMPPDGDTQTPKSPKKVNATKSNKQVEGVPTIGVDLSAGDAYQILLDAYDDRDLNELRQKASHVLEHLAKIWKLPVDLPLKLLINGVCEEIVLGTSLTEQFTIVDWMKNAGIEPAMLDMKRSLEPRNVPRTQVAKHHAEDDITSLNETTVAAMDRNFTLPSEEKSVGSAANKHQKSKIDISDDASTTGENTEAGAVIRNLSASNMLQTSEDAPIAQMRSVERDRSKRKQRAAVSNNLSSLRTETSSTESRTELERELAIFQAMRDMMRGVPGDLRGESNATE